MIGERSRNKTLFIAYLPSLGITLFVGLYIFSALLYPGGSQADSSSVGFDWANNYWCNLMNANAMNGDLNPGRPFAISAMIILCVSLAIFFIRFAEAFIRESIWKSLVKISGGLSMFFAALIATQYHDLMTIISSVFGFIVVIGIVKTVYQSNMTLYKIGGLICLLLLGLNNCIYYTDQGISMLPLLQKITFALVLLWIIGLNQKLIIAQNNVM